ncbi:MAG: PadR family transcriptional regulator [Ignavibacteria bacterium]|nr:PadR family transcriptional regulator [Ignavibacteria bacterium]
MLPINSSEVALLGILNAQPMYPYQLEQAFRYHDMRYWTKLSMSSIYKTLRKLQKKKLVTVTNDLSRENRVRTLYEITTEGKEILSLQLKELLSKQEVVVWPFDIALYNADLLPVEFLLEQLQSYKEKLGDKLNGFLRLQKFIGDGDGSLLKQGVAMRHIAMLEAEIEWLNQYIEQISSQYYQS